MKKTVAQLVRFGVVGSINTVIDLFVYIVLTRNLQFFSDNYLFAAISSFLVAGINGYFFNKRWTFKDGAGFSHKQMILFYIEAGIALAMNLLLLWWFVQLGMNDVLAKLTAGVTAGVLNFLMQKFWIFRQK